MRKLQVEHVTGLLFERLGVFNPTATSRILANSAHEILPQAGSILDLGCGSGIVGLQLMLTRRGTSSLSMSDVSRRATILAHQNASYLGFDANVRTGSLFDPWHGMFFNSIVSDVSGVAPRLGEKFGWFNGVSNESGEDGSFLAKKVLKTASSYLEPNGQLVFPLISLSDEAAILDVAGDHFCQIEKLVEVPVPLPIRSEEVEALQAQHPFVRVRILAGMPVFFTSVYSCRNSKGEL